MTDARTMAFINCFAILGALRQLCELSAQARELIQKDNISVGIAVKDGPEATFYFEEGKCRLEAGVSSCDIKLPFASPEKFNAFIDGKYTPIPTKGITKVGFLTGSFKKLTEILTKYLKATPADLEDDDFFVLSTNLMFHVIVGAVVQIGNEDKVGRVSAGYIVDGVVKLAVNGGPSASIMAKDHRLTPIHRDVKDYLSIMEFDNIRLARDLFDGRVNAMNCVADGSIRLAGMISQIDNVNRILDRVGVYLA